jgi:hypothetical protein
VVDLCHLTSAIVAKTPPIGEVIGGGIVLKAIWRRNLKELKALVEASPK